VAETVSGWEGSVSHIWAPQAMVLPLSGFGLLASLLLQGRIKMVGAVTVIAAVFLWATTSRPVLLVADNGALLGRYTEKGRALSRASGSGFVAGIWLENDGGPVAQEIAAGREGFTFDDRLTRTEIGELRILQVSGKTALAALQGCGGADLLISNQTDIGLRPCRAFGLEELRGTGALALSPHENGVRVTTARDVAGARAWNTAFGAPTPSFVLLAQ
jgi:competence protein ComEC